MYTNNTFCSYYTHITNLHIAFKFKFYRYQIADVYANSHFSQLNSQLESQRLNRDPYRSLSITTTAVLLANIVHCTHLFVRRTFRAVLNFQEMHRYSRSGYQKLAETSKHLSNSEIRLNFVRSCFFVRQSSTRITCKRCNSAICDG